MMREEHMDSSSSKDTAHSRPTRHGAMGIVSFVMTLLVFSLSMIDLGIAGYLHNTGQATPGSTSIVGLVIILCIFLLIMSIVFGIIGLLDQSSKKLFSGLGLGFSLGTLAIIVGIVILGLAMKARGSA
jgi:heme/copper-type cytochrome/quinol oxidase subunit 3